MATVLVCHVEEFGYLPVDKREPSDVLQEANTMSTFSFRAENELEQGGMGGRKLTQEAFVT